MKQQHTPAPMTRAKAVSILAQLGLELYEGSGRQPDGSWHATIDAVGRRSFNGDCMGYCVSDYTATGPQFWQMVVDEAKAIAPLVSECPHPPGRCDFHD